MMKLAILSFFLAATNAVIIRDNYDVVTKYNCWKDAHIFLDRGLIFRFEEVFLNNWPGNIAFDCSMPIENYYKSPGIISVIQHLKFRETENGCMDYIQFNERNQYQRIEDRICGEMIMGQIFPRNGASWNPPKFISEFSGPFRSSSLYTKHSISPGAFVQPSSDTNVKVHVDEMSLQPGERLAFTISFTGFVECDGLNVPKGMFNCGYGVCILEMFVGDGIVNCPFGDCRDEGGCQEALEDIDVLTDGQYNQSSTISNSTEAMPMINTPFLQWLRNNPQGTGLSAGREDKNVVKELENIKEELKKNSDYLERIIQMLVEKRSA